jgi:hypothetical protein
MSDRVLTFLTRPEVWTSGLALAGFLALYWVIRGAPIGQASRDEPDDAPRANYRDRVVALAVGGFLLVLAGAWLATTRGVPWSLPLFASGFGIVVAVLKVNARYRHASPTLRRVLEFSETALTASLVAGILVVGNVVAFKYGARALDLTHDRAYSLSSGTLRRLEALDRPVKFTVFHGNSERSLRQLDRVRQLVDLYRSARPTRVSVEYLDHVREVNDFEALAKRIPALAASPGDGIVIEYGEGETATHAVIPTHELFEGGRSRFEARPDRFLSSFNGEDVVTSAVARLAEGKRSKVAFTTGHDEPPTGEIDPRQPGVGLWKLRLSAIGTDVIELNLLRDEIPDDVPLLVIVSPQAPFQPGEIERIQAHIKRGGRLLLLLGNTKPSGLDDFLRSYNVEVGQGVVVDPRLSYMGREWMIYVPVSGGTGNPVTESLANRAVLFQNAAPLTLLGDSGKAGKAATTRKAVNPAVLTSPFLQSRAESWVEMEPRNARNVRDPAREPAGPATIGAGVAIRPALETEQPVPRMVVFASSHLADNGIIAAEPSNLDLLMNAVHWLRGRPELAGIAPKTHESLLFTADPGLQFRLVMVPTLMAFVVIIGLGITTYLARRD